MSETNIARALIDRNSGTAPAGDVDVQAVIDRAERMPAPAGSSRLEVMAGRVFSADHVKSLNTGILPTGEVSAANLHIDNIGTLLAADIPTLIPMIELPVPGMIPPTTLRQICETSLMSSPRIWAEYSTMAAPAQADFLARAMKRDGGFQKAIMTGYAELTDPATLAAASGGVESAAVQAERARLQAEISADRLIIDHPTTGIDARLARLTTQIAAFESSFNVLGNIVPGAKGLALTNLAREEAGYRAGIDLLNQGISPLQTEIDLLKRKRETYFGRTVKDTKNERTVNVPGVDPHGNPAFIGRDQSFTVEYFADNGDTTSLAYKAIETEISNKEGELKKRRDEIVLLSQQLARVAENRRQTEETHANLAAERTRLQGEKAAAEAALAPKQARMAELGTAGESIATAYKDRLYSIIPEAFQTTINAQLAELSLAQDQVDQDRLERAVTTNSNKITTELYKFARTASGERNHAKVNTEWRKLMTKGPEHLETLMKSMFTDVVYADLQKDPEAYFAVRTDLLKKMYRYRTEYRRPVTPATGGFWDSFRYKRDMKIAEADGVIPEAELQRFVELAGENVLRSGLASEGVQRALSELTGTQQLDPSLPLEEQLRGKKGPDLQAILSILFLVGGASLISLLGGRTP